jgi:hypothetical protein
VERVEFDDTPPFRYLVTAEGDVGAPRTFVYEQEWRLEPDTKVHREGAFYEVLRVEPDPSGQYDGLATAKHRLAGTFPDD